MGTGFLVFIDDADDAACYPLSSLLGMTVASDATILMKFKSSLDPASSDNDLVTLTCTSDKERECMIAIATQVNKASGVVVVADDVKSEYCHQNITGCAITLDT